MEQPSQNPAQRCKVAFIISSFKLGGKEQMLLSVINSLDQNRFEPILFVSKGGGNRIASVTGARVYVATPQGANVLRSLPALWHFICHEKPQIIWCVGAQITGLAGRLFSFLLRTPIIIISLHGRRHNVVMDWPNRLITRLTTDKVVTTSQAFGRALVAEGLPPHLVQVIYNGTDTDHFLPVTDRASYKERLLHIDRNRLVVGTVGNLLPVKAQHVLLKAAADVLKSFPDTLFVLVGDGTSRQKLEDYASDLGISDKVLFLGQRTDVPELLGSFDIFVLTSNDESFGNVITEAMSCGLPVVSTAVGGVPELVTNETGILVAPGDHKGISDALQTLIKNPERRQQLGKAGRERTLSYFSRQAMVETRESLFMELLSSKGISTF